MELTGEQVILIGVVASIVVQMVKLAAGWFGISLHRKGITFVLFGISLILAVLFVRPAVPAWPVLSADPGAAALLIAAYLTDWIALLSAIVGFAVVIYNILLQKVFDALGLAVVKEEQAPEPELKGIEPFEPDQVH